jgi:ubiquitin-conjugating enzyme E2 variant
VEVLAIVLQFVLAGWLLMRTVVANAAGEVAWTVIVAAVAVGYLLADVLSGIIHWAGDRLGSERTFLLGPHVVRPFREHHSDPRAITRHGFIETNGNNCMGASMLLALGFVLPVQDAGGVFVQVTLVVMCLAIFGTNQFHKWSHLPRVPPWIALLQHWHFILPPAHHDVHHAAPHDRYYCITTGWMNEPLRRVRFFEALEWFVEHALGLTPHRD